jgi:hypothetical protein
VIPREVPCGLNNHEINAIMRNKTMPIITIIKMVFAMFGVVGMVGIDVAVVVAADDPPRAYGVTGAVY